MEERTIWNIGKYSFLLLCIGYALFILSVRATPAFANAVEDPELAGYVARAHRLGIFESAENTLAEIMLTPLPELVAVPPAAAEQATENATSEAAEVAVTNQAGMRLIVNVWSMEISKEIGGDQPLYRLSKISEEAGEQDSFVIGRLVNINPEQTADFVRALNNGSFNPYKSTEHDAESTVRNLEITTGEMMLTEIDLSRGWNPSATDLSASGQDDVEEQMTDESDLAMMDFNETDNESIAYLAVESMEDLNFLLENEEAIEHEVLK